MEKCKIIFLNEDETKRATITMSHGSDFECEFLFEPSLVAAEESELYVKMAFFYLNKLQEE